MFFITEGDQIPVEVEKPVFKAVEIPFGMAFPVRDPLQYGNRPRGSACPLRSPFAAAMQKVLSLRS